QNLIDQWVGADAVDPASRGPSIDARHLAVVEAFYGTTYDQVNGANATLNGFTANSIESTYESIIDELKIRFVAQVPTSQLLNGVDWSSIASGPLLPFTAIAFNPQSDAVNVDFNTLVGSIIQNAPTDAAAQPTYYDQA